MLFRIQWGARPCFYCAKTPFYCLSNSYRVQWSSVKNILKKCFFAVSSNSSLFRFPKSHRDCNNSLAAPASCLAKNAQKVEHLRREATFSYYFGTPRPLPSIPVVCMNSRRFIMKPLPARLTSTTQSLRIVSGEQQVTDKLLTSCHYRRDHPRYGLALRRDEVFH